METTARTTPATTHQRTQLAFHKAKLIVAAYGALSSVVLLTVVIRALTGHTVSSFMWGRSGGVLASAAVTYWLTGVAAQGKRWAYVRVRVVSVVVPIAIVAVDVIGGLPGWFVAMQVVCALTIGATAFVVNGSEVRAAFPKER
ncbi:hypothetical protein ACIBL5_05295 [Streptomyces sp. NPDC050516]|uniref:hypothetical protein n=1 Tax=Streptomyces sp. NPDC050516 TaxID=3365621 RepID=UPI0037A7ACA4